MAGAGAAGVRGRKGTLQLAYAPMNSVRRGRGLIALRGRGQGGVRHPVQEVATVWPGDMCRAPKNGQRCHFGRLSKLSKMLNISAASAGMKTLALQQGSSKYAT